MANEALNDDTFDCGDMMDDAPAEKRDFIDVVSDAISGDAEAKKSGLIALGVLGVALAFVGAFYHCVIKSAVKAALRETGVARK
ncbi:hypothetical protein BLEM_0151 [Bifidobacterium lemurum]|uniref:Uncharacterized protein n=1 Tax=Bifidobacterium lemurum TaxID=1603886 RepID=A0A261FWF3_9BIFI|nr:hypothetical protein [Bifidobacterium lemurum]OZG63448.1 hypothetical protein BLEM_0151 [Bifidobacterium lemurum]QOL34349.1 hypothetical protein BL8807_11710 [Bifidobacterium lemurum]